MDQGIMAGESLMGPIIAFLYAAFVLYAYVSQIRKLKKKGGAHDVSARYFLYTWYAIILRAMVVGVIFYETKSITAIILACVEVMNFLGRLFVFIQIRYYQRKEAHKARSAWNLLADMAPGMIEKENHKEAKQNKKS